MNLPNALSLLRVFLVAPFLVALIYDHLFAALAFFIAAGVSDFLDGYLARKLNQTSVLGAFLDPLGDRLLSTVAYTALAVQGLLPAWLAVAVVAKDLYVGLGAGILYLTGHLKEAIPSVWGKVSTLLQNVTVGFALLAALTPLPSTLLDLLYWSTGVVTVVACFHYIWREVQIFAENSAER